MTTNKAPVQSEQQSELVGDFVMDFYVKNDRLPTLEDYILHLDYDSHLKWLEEVNKIDEEVLSHVY